MLMVIQNHLLMGSRWGRHRFVEPVVHYPVSAPRHVGGVAFGGLSLSFC
jgi:hypothetical protein